MLSVLDVNQSTVRHTPLPHKDFGSTCEGLVHAERFVNNLGEVEVALVCDKCFANLVDLAGTHRSVTNI